MPWQNTRDAYRIWVSEIMLQQTQVAAVIGYYGRFLARFPDVRALAGATGDEVMGHWSGLGYYSRARNMHRAAKIIVDELGGEFPGTSLEIAQLPGIGRSTAAAIACFAFGERAAILDGNVKRVFARHFGIDEYPGLPKVEKALWIRAEGLLPRHGVEAYTQGLMDLGATLCSRSRPRCTECPLGEKCDALRTGRVASLPKAKPRKPRPRRECVMLVVLHANAVVVERRPPVGIWGGLWCLPQADDAAAAAKLALGLGARWAGREPLAAVEHDFTHYHLSIKPFVVSMSNQPDTAPMAVQASSRKWLALDEVGDAGLPAPVKKLLKGLARIG